MGVRGSLLAFASHARCAARSNSPLPTLRVVKDIHADVRRQTSALPHRRTPMPLAARDIMQRNVRTIGPDVLLLEAGRELLAYRVSGFPVVERGQLIGM